MTVSELDDFVGREVFLVYNRKIGPKATDLEVAVVKAKVLMTRCCWASRCTDFAQVHREKHFCNTITHPRFLFSTLQEAEAAKTTFKAELERQHDKA